MVEKDRQVVLVAVVLLVVGLVSACCCCCCCCCCIVLVQLFRQRLRLCGIQILIALLQRNEAAINAMVNSAWLIVLFHSVGSGYALAVNRRSFEPHSQDEGFIPEN
jgi:hypothetical protein